MLELTQAQGHVLDATAHQHFTARLQLALRRLADHTGVAVATAEQVASMRARGTALGLVSERAMAAWLLVSVVLGADFERRHSWIADILADLGNGTADQRVSLVLQASCQEYARARSARSAALDEQVLAALGLFSTGAPLGAYERSAAGHAGIHIEALRFVAAIPLRADGGEVFDDDHWVLRRRRQSYPLAYPAGAPLSVLLSLRVDRPPARPEWVVVVARGNNGIRLEGRLRVTPDVGCAEVTVRGACLPDQVRAYEPLVLEWVAVVDNMPERLLLRTLHPLYLLLQAPADTILDWTAVAVSCVAADGCTSVQALRHRIAAASASTSLRRRSDEAELRCQDTTVSRDLSGDPLRVPADLDGVVRLAPASWQLLWQNALAAHGV